MNQEEADRLVREISERWLADPESSVEWAGLHEGRRGIRMRQQAREATTIWFTVGERTVRFEAYLLPRPPTGAEEAYRIALARKHRSWPATISLDDRGDLFISGRIPLTDLRHVRLDEAVGAVYEVVELTFRTLVKAGFAPREKSL